MTKSLFKPGQSGNPQGRPKGSRNKLGEQFLSNLQDDWLKHGPAALVRAREEKPMEYVKMVASLLPKELLLRRAPEADMTDEELEHTLDLLTEVADRLREIEDDDFNGPGISETTH